MIYLDSSVVLAKLFAENRVPQDSFWRQELISSRLLEYEVWSRIHARHLAGAPTLAESTRQLISLVQLVELAPRVLERALHPFPVPLRTLDTLHLASLDYIRIRHRSVLLASFDVRLQAGARALNIPIYDL